MMFRFIFRYQMQNESSHVAKNILLLCEWFFSKMKWLIGMNIAEKPNDA